MKDRKIEFPKWKGYSSITKEETEFLKKCCLDDIDEMSVTLAQTVMREEYFRGILLWIQDKMDRGEVWKLDDVCLNSAKEMFGIMISVCEKDCGLCDDMINMGDVKLYDNKDRVK